MSPVLLWRIRDHAGIGRENVERGGHGYDSNARSESLRQRNALLNRHPGQFRPIGGDTDVLIHAARLPKNEGS